MRDLAALVRKLCLDRVLARLTQRLDGSLPAHVVLADIVCADERLHAAEHAGLSGIRLVIAIRVPDAGAKEKEHTAPHQEIGGGAKKADESVHSSRSVVLV